MECCWMKFRFLRYSLAIAVVPALVFGSAALLSWRVNAAEGVTHVPLPISVNAVMVSLVDQAAHQIWDGGNQARDLTEREWLLIDLHSQQLAASASAFSLGGTGPADMGWAMSPAWQDWSGRMAAAAMSANAAALARDKGALRTAGDALVETCESCHQIFKPDVPSEGIMHQPHLH
nr:MAG: hypothetical protein E4H34_05310 [Hyphomicrobiales bacterium]